MHHLDWYHKQEEKRKDSRRRNDISLINQELKSLLQRAQSFINREDYKEEARMANRVVQQSSIWNIGYINNMESERVAVEQALLLKVILKRDGENIRHGKAMDSEVDYVMRRLGNVDWGIYTTYNQRLNRL